MRDQAKVEGLSLPQSANTDYPGNKLPRIIFGVTDLESYTYLAGCLVTLSRPWSRYYYTQTHTSFTGIVLSFPYDKRLV